MKSYMTGGPVTLHALRACRSANSSERSIGILVLLVRPAATVPGRLFDRLLVDAGNDRAVALCLDLQVVPFQRTQVDALDLHRAARHAHAGRHPGPADLHGSLRCDASLLSNN